MVIGDFDPIRVAIRPRKTDSPLVVDADAVLPFPVAPEALQPVSRRHPKVFEVTGIIQYSQLATADALNLNRKAA